MIKCKAGKIINPDTGRCVNKDGKIGKLIKETSVKKNKCKAEKIINPDTGRCVNKDGKIGKMIKISVKNSVKKSVKNRVKKSVKKSVKNSGKKLIGCVRQTTAKYHVATRKSPPYPANQCQGKSLFGNDGNMYESLSNVNGIYTWRLKK